MMMFSTVMKWSLYITITTLALGACAEFPSFPEILIRDMMFEEDMKILEDMEPDMERVNDMDLDMELDMEMVVNPDMEADMELDMEPDMELDMEIEVANFQETRCVGGFIEGSDRRYLNGVIETSADPLPCGIEGERLLRVDPLEQIGFSTTDFQNPELGDPIKNLSTDYTYFFMAREVSFSAYRSQCVETERPEDPIQRSSEATCLSPETLASEIVTRDDCSVFRQDEYRASEEGSMATGEARDLPMNCVDWESAANYCRRIGGRLPTEAEWELASSYGRTIYPRSWPANAQNLCDYANIKLDSETSCQESNPTRLDALTMTTERLLVRPTCSGANNPWSEAGSILCDVIGNVAEWTLDDSSPISADTLHDNARPMVVSNDHLSTCPTSGLDIKVVRGGSINNGGNTRNINSDLSLYSRAVTSCSDSNYSIYSGFRCVISPQRHGVSEWTVGP